MAESGWGYGKRLRRRATVLLAALTLGATGAAASGPALRFSVEGPPEAVFLWRRDACARYDFPDAPARAFRDANGRTHLIATHLVNRILVGPDLDRVRPDCEIAFRGSESDRPEDYDDRGWLASVYTLDGRTVYALVHNEFQGNRRPALCPSERYWWCWYNAVTFARSTDGGRSFTTGKGSARLVAAAPYRFRGDRKQRVGYFSPSNILRRGGFFYTFVLAERFGAQQGGVCLLRTGRLADPRSWRAWDGSGFAIRFVDPYREAIAKPGRHVCRPVEGLLRAPVGSVTYHAASGTYIAIQTSARPIAVDDRQTTGVFAATSRDLLHWSRPRLLWAAPIFDAFACGGDAASYGYASLLDPSSPSRNFETTDDEAFLYLTRFNLDDCVRTADRDLVRVPVRIAEPPAN